MLKLIITHLIQMTRFSLHSCKEIQDSELCVSQAVLLPQAPLYHRDRRLKSRNFPGTRISSGLPGKSSPHDRKSKLLDSINWFCSAWVVLGLGCGMKLCQSPSNRPAVAGRIGSGTWAARRLRRAPLLLTALVLRAAIRSLCEQPESPVCEEGWCGMKEAGRRKGSWGDSGRRPCWGRSGQACCMSTWQDWSKCVSRRWGGHRYISGRRYSRLHPKGESRRRVLLRVKAKQSNRKKQCSPTSHCVTPNRRSTC